MGGHVRVYWSILDSPAWHALSYADQALYMALRRDLGATNNGNISATLKTMRHRGFTSSATLAKCLRALQAVELIDKTRQGGIANGGKECCLYRFTDQETWPHPKKGVAAMKPSHGWRRFASRAQAAAVIREAHANARRPTPNGVESKVQKLKRADSKFEPGDANCASEAEHDADAATQILNTNASAADRRKTA